MIGIILGIVALVIAIIALILILGMRKMIHTTIMHDVSSAIAQWSQNFQQNVNNSIPPFVKGAVDGAILAANIPGVVKEEIVKHQSGALLLEGPDVA